VGVDIKEFSEKIILIKNQQLRFINATEPSISKDNREILSAELKKKKRLYSIIQVDETRAIAETLYKLALPEPCFPQVPN